MLLHQSNPNTLTAAVCCFIKVTALVETRETAGLRNLAQETILDLPVAEGLTLGDRLSDLGLQATVQTSPDYVEAMFQGTADQLPELLRAVRVVLSNAKPAARQINLRRAEVLRQLEERRELPLPVARDRAQSHLYRDTPCSWPTTGTPTVASITADRLLALRQMRYAPNRTVVSVSGNISWEQCRQQAREALGDLLPVSVPVEPPPPPPAPARTALLYEPWRGDNAVVLLAAPSPSPDRIEFAAATVAHAVLGSGEGSRLFRALRDRLGLTYSIASDV
ncbi:MAG: M16 family metallopeptidase, partial [Bacteroidota bacterium]